MQSKETKKSSRREKVVAVLLVVCVLLIAGWEVAAHLAARPFDELRLHASDFDGFSLKTSDWQMRLVHKKATPTEPTAVAYEIRRTKPAGAPLLSRIVHGYNMVDCMRIKGYKVERLIDTRTEPAVVSAELTPKERSVVLEGPPIQIWRLTAASGKVSVWATTMLRAADFAATQVDTRDMAFPRIGTPDDPAWQPTGLKLSSFRHPVRNSRNAVRARWNASRCDLLTFLRLRQPAWASNDMVTFVTEYHGPSVTAEDEPEVIAYVARAHRLMLAAFQSFWHGRSGENAE